MSRKIPWDALWVGDELYWERRDEIVRFEGVIDERRVRVRSSKGIEVVLKVELRPIAKLDGDSGIPGTTKDYEIKPQRGSKGNKPPIDTVLDLHPEALAEKLKRSPSKLKLHDALEVARDFIQEANERGKRYLRIIHGKGDGKLRAALIQMFERDFDQVIERIEHLPDGGSIVLWLRG